MANRENANERNESNDRKNTAPTVANECHPEETAVRSTAQAPVDQQHTENANEQSAPKRDGNDVTSTNTKRDKSAGVTLKDCEFCGNAYVTKRPSQSKYCGATCRHKAWLERHPDKAAEKAESDKERLRRHLESRGIPWIE